MAGLGQSKNTGNTPARKHLSYRADLRREDFFGAIRRFCSCEFRWPRDANWPTNSASRGACTLRRAEKSRRRNRSEVEITAVPMGRYS